MSSVEATVETDSSTSKSKKKSSLWGNVQFVLLLVAIFVLFKFIVGFTFVSGNSMNPTLENDDIMVTLGLVGSLERGDVVIFHDEHGFDVVKRVIGLPGDTIEIRDGVVYLNGEVLEEDYTTGTSYDMKQVTVSENAYFVMGDNRVPGESLDSRSEDLGLVPDSSIESKVLLSLFSFKTF